MKKAHRLWTDEEIQFLKDNVHLTYKEIGDALNRSVSSVQKRSNELGLLEKRKKYYKNIWTDEKIEYLKENYATATFEEMQKQLGKSIPTIRWKGRSLGLKRKSKTKTKLKRWTSEEIEFLEKNYRDVDTAIIAKKLGKSVEAVIQKANKLNLYKRQGEEEITEGIKLKCTYLDQGRKKSRDIFYPTERCEKKAAARAIDGLTNYMKFTDVKVVEARKL